MVLYDVAAAAVTVLRQRSVTTAMAEPRAFRIGRDGCRRHSRRRPGRRRQQKTDGRGGDVGSRRGAITAHSGTSAGLHLHGA